MSWRATCLPWLGLLLDLGSAGPLAGILPGKPESSGAWDGFMESSIPLNQGETHTQCPGRRTLAGQEQEDGLEPCVWREVAAVGRRPSSQLWAILGLSGAHTALPDACLGPGLHPLWGGRRDLGPSSRAHRGVKGRGVSAAAQGIKHAPTTRMRGEWDLEGDREFANRGEEEPGAGFWSEVRSGHSLEDGPKMAATGWTLCGGLGFCQDPLVPGKEGPST